MPDVRVPSAVAAAALVGGVLAVDLRLGLALVVGCAYLRLLVTDLPLAVLLWVPLVVFEAVPGLEAGAEAVTALVLLAVLVSPVRRDRLRAFLRRERSLLLPLGLLLGWATASATWAVDPAQTLATAASWYAAALMFLLVGTCALEPGWPERAGRWLIGSGVVAVSGGLLAAALGLGGLGEEGRLQAGAGDPNYLGMWLLVGVILALGLTPAGGGPGRAVTLTSAAVLVIGIGAAASRGAFLAAGVTALVAVALPRPGRRRRARPVLLALLVGLAALAVSHPARTRLLAQNEGNGRLDLWRVAWRMVQENPVTGVGLGNFTSRGTEYMREVGPLYYLDLVATRPHEVHNAYLQLSAEIGVVGLGLFGWFFLACARSAWRASVPGGAPRADRSGDSYALAVLLALCSTAVANVFLSAQVDQVLWLLLALVPGLGGSSAAARPYDDGAQPRSDSREVNTSPATRTGRRPGADLPSQRRSRGRSSTAPPIG